MNTRDIDAYLNTARAKKGKNKGKKIDAETVKARRNFLSSYQEWMDSEGYDEWFDISPREVGYYMSDLEDSGVFDVYNHLKALVLFYDYLKQDNDKDNPAKIHAESSTYIKEYTKRKENGWDTGVTDGEFAKLLDNVGSRFSARNTLVLILLGRVGLRRSEVTELTVGDVDYDRTPIKLRVPGTKSSPRTLLVPSRYKTRFRRWIEGGQRDSLMHAYDSDKLLLSSRKPELSGGAIREIVHHTAQRAGIQESMYEDASKQTRWRITPHQLRHYFGKREMSRTDGMDLKTLSEYMGHSSIEITADLYGQMTEAERLKMYSNYIE